jgi:hypothetical protein
MSFSIPTLGLLVVCPLGLDRISYGARGGGGEGGLT